MSFALRVDETIDHGMRRLASMQFDAALQALDGQQHDLDEQIHDARQALKRLRSLLRLLRGELGEAEFRRDNAALRDVARELARAREAAALIESFDDLFEDAERAARERFQPVRTLLTSRCHERRAQELAAGAMSRAAEELVNLRKRVSAWPKLRDDFEALAPGLRQSYRSGRRALERARRTVTDESLHEWRKREKHHLHHVRLLAGIFPEELEARGEALHALSDALGKLHDLSLLRGELPRLSDTEERVADLDALEVFMNFQELRLQNRAFSLGRKLYAEKPRALLSRLAALFEVWRADLEVAVQAVDGAWD